MPQAITVTLEKEMPAERANYLKAGAGKALAREIDRLDSTARRRKVAAITSLLSESQAELIAQMKEEGFDPSKMRLPPELWFAAAEGLVTLRAIAGYVGENLNDFKQPNPILRDLKSAETLLAAAESAGIRFHFTKVTV